MFVCVFFLSFSHSIVNWIHAELANDAGTGIATVVLLMRTELHRNSRMAEFAVK